jgi:hypothetical protein
MDTDNLDQFISGILKLDMKHLSAEKRRELAIQIRSFNLERHSSRQVIRQTIQDMCRTVDWHFEMISSYDQLYQNYTIDQLYDQQLVDSSHIKIPRSCIVQKQVQSLPHLHLQDMKARMRSAKKLQSTLTSVSSPNLPHFGNISHIPQKVRITAQYKGNRRSSIKSAAILNCKNRRSSGLERKRIMDDLANDGDDEDDNDDDRLSDKSDESNRIDDDQSSPSSTVERLMQSLQRKQTLKSVRQNIQDVRTRIEHQFDVWMQQLDPNIADRLISDFKDIEFIV